MKHLQNLKFAMAIEPASINGTAATAIAVDTLNSTECLLIIAFGAIGAADFDSLKITECETSGGSYTDITGASFTAPTQSNDGTIVTCHVNGGGVRKRFIKIAADPGAVATLISGVAVLGGLSQTPNSDTERGTLQSLFV